VLARLLLASLQASVLLFCGAVFFKLPLGDHPWFVAPVVLCLGLFAGTLSILIGSLCQNEKQVVLAAILGAMLLASLGGCWWPIELVPDTFKTVAMLTPSYWAVHGIQSVLYFGRSWEVLLLECPVLIGFAALAGLAVLASSRIKRQN